MAYQDSNEQYDDEEFMDDENISDENLEDDTVDFENAEAANDKSNPGNSRRHVEKYFEKKRLRDELGSVFDDEFELDDD